MVETDLLDSQPRYEWMRQLQKVWALQQDGLSYPDVAPFHPSTFYPEYGFDAVGPQNATYDAVRQLLFVTGLDRTRYDTPSWNPMRELIRPGETVLLKPNLVKESHPRDPNGWRYTLTHGSLIRAVADYVWKALQGRGRILLADAPQTDSSWPAMVRLLGLNAICEFYRARGLNFELIDLRQEAWENRGGVIVARRPLPGDPNGYADFDLGSESEFAGHGGAGRYYGADYDADEVNRHHSGGRHEYRIAGSAIACDVVFNLPKLKTHKKAGITVALKNLVGVNGDKNWLPHHTEGSPESGGDERPTLQGRDTAERGAVRLLHTLSLRVPGLGPWIHRLARHMGQRVFGDTEEVVRSGNWWGNDTAWRMCLDLNKIVLYGRPDGSLGDPREGPLRRHYSLVDGIIAGEGRGPMNPDPVAAGVLLFGTCPACVDATAAILMGFDPERLPIVRQAFRCRGFPIASGDWRDVVVLSNRPDWCGRLESILAEATFHFAPHFGWKGQVERGATDAIPHVREQRRPDC